MNSVKYGDTPEEFEKYQISYHLKNLRVDNKFYFVLVKYID